jgi:hypothetical protein
LTPARCAAWDAAVAQVRADHRLYASLLRSVRSSMAFEGFMLSLDESEALFEQALSGPPLVFQGLEEG